MSHKILILDTGKEWGGGTNSLIELLKRIDKNKYHFTAMFYNNYKRGSDSDIKTEIEKLGVDFLLLEQKKQSLAVKILKELARSLLFFSSYRKYLVFWIDYHFRIKSDAKDIAEILTRQDINLIYMNNQPSSNVEGIMAAKIVNIPSIQHSRIGADLHRFEVNAVNNWLTRMICVSQGVKEVFIKQGVDASKCEVIYNGIDSNIKPFMAASEIRKKWGIKDNEILIGTVGSLIKRKRINDLIEALVELREKSDKPFKCMVVGDGPERENLQKEVLQRGLKEEVIFTGFQSDAISYMNAMDIFVLPSEKEGLPRVILEAMLMARPVVACNVTGSSELVIDGETGFLVSVKGTDMLANALLKLVASDDLRRRMGEKSRMSVIERFTIDKYVNGVSNIFEEVLA